MVQTIFKDYRFRISVFFFSLYTAWWVYIQFYINKESSSVIHYFSGTYGVIAILGAYWGLRISQRWGSFKSLIGRAIAMFSIGIFLQEFGQLAYAYYIVVLKIETPYPSIGDIGYFGSIFFYLYGIYLVAKASGIKVSLHSYSSKMQAVIIPLSILTYSYFLFLRDYQLDWSNPLAIILDFGYPLGQACYISLALLAFILTRGILGGVMKVRILFILFALLLQFLADFNFLFESSHETWVTAGYGDYLYLCAYFIMVLSILQFRMSSVKSHLEVKNNE